MLDNLSPARLTLMRRWVMMMLVPVTDELVFLFARNFYNDASCLNWLVGENKHLACDGLPWFVVRILRLDLYITLGEGPTRIPRKHLKLIKTTLST